MERRGKGYRGAVGGGEGGGGKAEGEGGRVFTGGSLGGIARDRGGGLERESVSHKVA